jgi:hypothetical protein
MQLIWRRQNKGEKHMPTDRLTPGLKAETVLAVGPGDVRQRREVSILPTRFRLHFGFGPRFVFEPHDRHRR